MDLVVPVNHRTVVGNEKNLIARTHSLRHEAVTVGDFCARRRRAGTPKAWIVISAPAAVKTGPQDASGSCRPRSTRVVQAVADERDDTGLHRF
jgi:hypothetical protein